MPILVFTHIPKTAGSSFARTIHPLYRDEELLFAIKGKSSLEEFVKKGKAAGLLRYIGGHAKLHEVISTLDISAEDLLPIAMVREPLERAISHFLYFRRIPNALPSAGHLMVDANFEDFFDIARRHAGLELRNFQCWFLSGERRFKVTKKRIEDEYLIVSDTKYFETFCERVGQLACIRDRGRLNPITVNQAPIAQNSKETRLGHRPLLYTDLVSPEYARFFREENEEDYKLFDFINNQHSGLFIGGRFQQYTAPAAK